MMFALKIPRYAAIGMLEALWHFTARYCPRGDIGRFGDETIASAAYWDGDPHRFAQVLTECGWLDACEESRLVVHDWHDHADEATKKHLKRQGLEFARPVRTVSRQRQTRSRTLSRQKPPAVAVAVPKAIAEPEPEPVPQTCAVSPTPGIPDSDRPAYADAVWQEFLNVSGIRGTRLMSPGEFNVLKGWMDQGVPLRIVLRGISDTRGKGSSLGYYGPSVKKAIEAWSQALPIGVSA